MPEVLQWVQLGATGALICSMVALAFLQKIQALSITRSAEFHVAVGNAVGLKQAELQREMDTLGATWKDWSVKSKRQEMRLNRLQKIADVREDQGGGEPPPPDVDLPPGFTAIGGPVSLQPGEAQKVTQSERRDQLAREMRRGA